MKNITRFMLIGLSCIFFFSCKKDEIITTPEPTGIISGKIVAQNNRTPIPNALIFVTTPNGFYSTYTDVDGNFTLTAAAGDRDLHIQTGNGDKFRTVLRVSITEDQTTILSLPVNLNQVASLAYIPGTYDKIESILRDTLGYNAQYIDPNNLMNIIGISSYDAVFINCGTMNFNTNPTTDSVLARYVSAGGSIYASDYAMDFIEGKFVLGTACGTDRYFGFIPDSLVCSRRTGTVSTVVGANVVSQELQTYLGRNAMDIIYNLGTWERIQYVNNDFWETMITDPTDGSPLFIRSNQYHQNSSTPPPAIGHQDPTQVTVCHTLPTGKKVNITISTDEAVSHFSHGDTTGSCNNPNNSGWIYFTTFHNEQNGFINQDMKRILEFMILNL
jgi:hypothetical protein